MFDYNALLVRTWTGEEKPVKKIALFVEKDPTDNVFYKIEGQNNMCYFMISYFYEFNDAWTEFSILMNKLIAFQVENLHKVQVLN